MARRSGYNTCMSMQESVKRAFPDSGTPDAGQLPALTLAYIGDTVYDLYVRAFLIHTRSMQPHALHTAAIRYVCAAGQAAAARRLEGLLSDEERAVFRRGRNAHSGTMPKNASGADYHAASALEALIGYLFMKGKDERIAELMRAAWEEEKHAE